MEKFELIDSHPLVCLGDALLDILAFVELDLLQKYELERAEAYLANKNHLPLYKELIDYYECDFIAGGSAQNTCRAAQWFSQTPNFTAFVGCVGEDEFSIRLKEATSDAGVCTYYQQYPNIPTGTCAVLIYKKERTLVANLSASKKLTLDFIIKLKDNSSLFQNSKVIYIEGYLLSHTTSIVKEILQYACKNGKIGALNLCAPYIIEFCRDNLLEVLPYCEYLFGNESGAQKFGETFGLSGDITEIVRQMSTMESETAKPRKVIITRAEKPTLYSVNGQVFSFPIEPISEDQILDVNGAGDAFIGGFLSELIKGNEIGRCIGAGHYLSRESIQLLGCSFPPTPNFEYI